MKCKLKNKLNLLGKKSNLLFKRSRFPKTGNTRKKNQICFSNVHGFLKMAIKEKHAKVVQNSSCLFL